MATQVRRSLVLALAGLLGGLGLVLALFGGGDALRRLAGPDGPKATAPEAGGTGRPAPRPGPAAGSAAGDAGPTAPQAGDAGSGGAKSAASQPSRADPTDSKPAGAKPEGDGSAPVAPSFDLVRVEPNGDTVVAGRGAPNTVVEMLLDGKPVARALADPTGQFAIVPPALPSGSSEIQLRIRGADGRETRSKQTVAVAVSAGRDRRPLVALTAPDSPTVVLSQPGAPEPAAKAAGARTPDAKMADAKASNGKTPEGKASDGKAAPGRPEPARIVSVDAQDGGRLFVTGAGMPGADLRLYLNDTLIAPGRAGPDGTVTFTIGRGVKPGQYQVRIDQVDAGTGKVRSRAEVPFAVPEPARTATREPPAPARPAEPHPREVPPDARAASDARAARPGTAGRAGPQGVAEDRRAAGAGAADRAQAAPAARDAAAPAAEPGPAKPATAASGPGGASGGRPGMAATASPANGATAAAAPPAEGAPARAGAVFVPEISTARITRGDNLWRISQRTYGQGHRYTVIFDANQDQIRDPDLIYPGQIFVLPADKRG